MSRWKLGWRLAHLPWLLTVTGVVLGLAGLGGAVVDGATGAAGAALGVAVVAASYLLSTLLIAWADRVDPQLVLPVGLGAYLVKFSLLGVAMAGLAASGWPGLAPMGVGVVAGVLAWTTTQIWYVLRHPPRLEYHPPQSAGAGSDSTR